MSWKWLFVERCGTRGSGRAHMQNPWPCSIQGHFWVIWGPCDCSKKMIFQTLLRLQLYDSFFNQYTFINRFSLWQFTQDVTSWSLQFNKKWSIIAATAEMKNYNPHGNTEIIESKGLKFRTTVQNGILWPCSALSQIACNSKAVGRIVKRG